MYLLKKPNAIVEKNYLWGGWVFKNLTLAYKVDGWGEKSLKYAYVIIEWSLLLTSLSGEEIKVCKYSTKETHCTATEP